MKNRVYKRSLSGLLAIIFLFQTVFTGFPQTWKTSTYPTPTPLKNFADITIPEKLGKIRSINLHNPENPTVIIIQDAHCVYHVQKNIEKLLEYLLERYDISFVGLEGASGKIDVSWVYKFNRSARKKVADKYMKEGLFTAAEKYMIVNGPEKNLFMCGVEDPELYWEDFYILRNILNLQNKFKEVVERFNRKLSSLKRKRYPQELLELDEKVRNYELGKLSLTELVKYLEAHYPLKSYPDIHRCYRICRIEELVNIEKIETQREAVFKKLCSIADSKDKAKLVKIFLSYRTGRISTSRFYKTIDKWIKQYKSSLGNLPPSLQLYINEMKLKNRLDKLKLEDEIRALVQDVYKEDYLPYPEIRFLISITNSFKNLEKLLDLKAVRADILPFFHPRGFPSHIKKLLAYMKSSGVESNQLESALGLILQFYTYVLEREESIVGNLLSKMKLYSSRKAILMCGGFHAEGIERLLNEKKINVISLIPTPEKLGKYHNEIYKWRIIDPRWEISEVCPKLVLKMLCPPIINDSTLPESIRDAFLKGPLSEMEAEEYPQIRLSPEQLALTKEKYPKVTSPTLKEWLKKQLLEYELESLREEILRESARIGLLYEVDVIKEKDILQVKLYKDGEIAGIANLRLIFNDIDNFTLKITEVTTFGEEKEIFGQIGSLLKEIAPKYSLTFTDKTIPLKKYLVKSSPKANLPVTRNVLYRLFGYRFTEGFIGQSLIIPLIEEIFFRWMGFGIVFFTQTHLPLHDIFFRLSLLDCWGIYICSRTL